MGQRSTVKRADEFRCIEKRWVNNLLTTAQRWKKNNSPIVLDHIQVADLESIMERMVKSGKISINQPTIEAEL